MIIIKFFVTVLIVALILFLKTLLKLKITKQKVVREITSKNLLIEKIKKPGLVKNLSIMPLIDYYADDNKLKTEAGVSYYIKADGIDILLDVGANELKEHPSALLSNMKILGKSFDDLNFIFLSHQHLDHVGGMKDQKKGTFTVSAGRVELPEIPVYSPTGIRPSALNPGPIPSLITDPLLIKDGIVSIGAIPRALYLVGYTLENSLAFNLEGKGIVLVIGCGHQTIEKIIERTILLFDEPIYGIIGGLHLPVGGGRLKIGPVDIQPIVGVDRPPWNAISKNDAENAISAIKKVNPSFIALSPHDSSDWTLQRFKEEFGDKCHDLKVGREFLFPCR